MTETWAQFEPLLRSAIFFGVLLLMMMWEWAAPRRQRRCSVLQRWGNNLALVFLNSALLRVLMPMSAVAWAHWVQLNGFGLFNHVHFPDWIKVIGAVMIMDMVIYWQHRLFHRIPIFWRLHRVHHVDQDIDVTTGARFHSIEILLSMLIKFAVIFALGCDPFAVFLFEVILNAMAMFNHGNVRIPLGLDKILRNVFVTPDMHRVHHSRIVKETNSNYGFNLSFWDRIFGSYIAQPAMGHDDMQIGVKGFDDKNQTQSLHRLLWLPFKK